VPAIMKENRIVDDFYEFIYEDNGDSIKISKGQYYKVQNLKYKGENVNIILF
jgi:hypothetical protein